MWSKRKTKKMLKAEKKKLNELGDLASDVGHDIVETTKSHKTLTLMTALAFGFTVFVISRRVATA